MRISVSSVFCLVAILSLAGVSLLPAADNAKYDPVAEAAKALAKMKVKPGDSPQMGLSQFRNNVSAAKNIPTDWEPKTGKNIKWTARLGSQTYPSPVVANGKVFIGTNNNNAYVKRYPRTIDLGCLLCIDEESGKFL